MAIMRLLSVQISNSTTRIGNHTIALRVLIHGTAIGIGKFDHSNTSLCGTSAKACAGNVYVTVLSSTRFIYSQNGGAVCAASHGIMEEASTLHTARLL